VDYVLKRPVSYVGPVSRVGEPYWVVEYNRVFTLVVRSMFTKPGFGRPLDGRYVFNHLI